jgi:hypothetical protein
VQRLTSVLAAALSLVCASPAFAQFFDHSGESDGSTKTLSDPHALPTMIERFFFYYKSGTFEDDHHIQRIAILSDYPQTDKTWVQFRDKNADDDYSYNIRLRTLDVPGAILGRVAVDDSGSDTHCATRGACAVPLNKPAGDYVFALRGFRLQYASGDHEIDHISIIEANGTLQVAFNDRNDDDRFRFEVEYVWLPRAAVEATGSVKGQRAKEDNTPVPHNKPVIAGFTVDYVNDDHDLKAFSISARGHVLFMNAAKHPSEFRWQLDWVALR